ncbi:MAG: hypothetical protein ACLVJH_07350 [Faecalibacterium prausnitzii]
MTAEVTQIAVSRTKTGGQSAPADGQQPHLPHYGGTDMMQFLIAAPRSGSGKTTVTCAVLTALQRRGAAPCAFKCGLDYIDPMFHRSALWGGKPQPRPVSLRTGYGARALRPLCRRARRCRVRGCHGLLRLGRD